MTAAPVQQLETFHPEPSIHTSWRWGAFASFTTAVALWDH